MAGGETDLAEHAAQLRYRADGLLIRMAREVRDGDLVLIGAAAVLPQLAVAFAQESRGVRPWIIDSSGHLSHGLMTRLTPHPMPGAGPRSWSVASIVALLTRRLYADCIEFLRPAQVDAAGALNLSRIYRTSGGFLQLPGMAGIPNVAASSRRGVLYLPQHSAEVLCSQVDHVSGTLSPHLTHRVHTELGVFTFESGRLRALEIAAGVTAGEVAERTGFPLDGLNAAVSGEQVTAADRALIEMIDPNGLRALEVSSGQLRRALLAEILQQSGSAAADVTRE